MKKLFLIALALALSAPAVAADGGLVTLNGIDRARLGMTLGELKKAYPGSKVAGPDAPDECVSELRLESNGQTLFRLMTNDAEDVGSYCDPRVPDDLEINWIYTDRPGFITGEGVGPGMPLKIAEESYGKAQIHALEYEETRWWVEFENAPSNNDAVIGFAINEATIDKRSVQDGIVKIAPKAIIEGVAVTENGP